VGAYNAFLTEIAAESEAFRVRQQAAAARAVVGY